MVDIHFTKITEFLNPVIRYFHGKADLFLGHVSLGVQSVSVILHTLMFVLLLWH